MELFDLAVLYQRLLSVDGRVRRQGRKATAAMGPFNQSHRVVLGDLLRAGQNRNHVTRPRGLLLALARTVASLDRGLAFLKSTGVESVRVVRCFVSRCRPCLVMFLRKVHNLRLWGMLIRSGMQVAGVLA